jgi:hypothetical protein
VLEYFDGHRSTADVRAAVKHETGFGLSESFITALHHHRILVGS